MAGAHAKIREHERGVTGGMMNEGHQRDLMDAGLWNTLWYQLRM